MSFDALFNGLFTDLFSDIGQFHFIRPEWLWTIPVLLLVWLIAGTLGKSTHWESFIAKDKLEALRVTGGRYSQAWRWLLILGWAIGTVAAAGPAWKQVPVPTVRDESALVIVLDLSRSMLAQDIAPDRLTRSKYKLIDILRARGDGQTALVAYAGDPHTVSPLTDDPRTIEALLPALHPGVMPIQGSNTEAAIELSIQLLKDAGVSRGEILLMTDGVAPEAQKYIRDLFNGSFKLSILGIGSTDAVPIPQETGGFFTDSRGEIILTKLNRDELQILAGLSGGRYVELQPDDSDIKYLLQDEFELSESSSSGDEEQNSLLYDSWEDMGYWLVLLILPFAAYSFRKGAVYALPLMIFMLPNESQALSMNDAWNNLWLTKDQQGAKLLQESKPADAAEIFERQDWAGIADFDAQNYQSAAERFADSSSIENTYNRGNALAFSGDLEGALKAYEQVLEQSPEHQDATHNKAVIEQLMQQQESGESGESGEDSQDQQSQDQQNQGQNQESQDQQTGDSEQQDQQEGQQSESESEQESQSGEESDQQQEQSQQQSQESDQQESEQAQNSEQQSGEEQSEEEKEAQAQQASEQDKESEGQSEEEIAANMTPAEATPEELQDTSEQWLRAIPDDPSGLLRRKFDYETRQNKLEQRYRLQIPTNPDDERY